jgi:phage baseplate assembly protein W
MARIFSIEDGTIDTVSITTSRNKAYSDLDLTFAIKGNKDVFKKNDAAAVKQAVKNLLLTNFGEKPFNPRFGGNLNAFLFNLDTEFDELEIEDSVAQAIANFEPRAILRRVRATLLPDQNSVNVKVVFQVVNVQETQELSINLARLR